LAAGGSQATLDALRDYVQEGERAMPRALSGDEALIARYTAQITHSVHVDDSLFGQLLNRFDPAQLVEITAAIATYNMVARFLVALGVTPEE
jgi:alkylhydroperoxidase family enzyme